MIIENNHKDIVTLLKWINSNTSKDPARPALTGINITRDEKKMRLEVTDGFTYIWVDVIGDGMNNDINKVLPDVPSGLYYFEILAKGMIKLETIDGRFPDGQSIVSREPRFDPTGLKKISAVCYVNPKLLSKIMPTFMSHVAISMNGAQFSINGLEWINDFEVHVNGILMPMYFPEHTTWFGADVEVQKPQRGNNMWLESEKEIVVEEVKEELKNLEFELA